MGSKPRRVVMGASFRRPDRPRRLHFGCILIEFKSFWHMEELLLFRRRGGNGDAASHESGGCLAADQDITFATFFGRMSRCSRSLVHLKVNVTTEGWLGPCGTGRGRGGAAQ